MFDLKGRTALVTGAGQGMGLGIVKALADAGASVYVNDIITERAAAAASDIDNAYALPGDITDPNIRKAMMDEIGDLDILCNNAGVPSGMQHSFKQVPDLSDQHYQEQMDLNFHAVRGLCALCLPGMKARGHGRILIISSEAHRLGGSRPHSLCSRQSGQHRIYAGTGRRNGAFWRNRECTLFGRNE